MSRLSRLSKKKLVRCDMDIRFRVGSLLSSSSSQSSWSTATNWKAPKPYCSKKDVQRNGEDNDNNNNNKGRDSSTDWDRAWSKFKKKGKKTLFSEFNPDKYVTWNPRRSEYPLSEEVDPIKRAERSNLSLWTNPKFTLALAIVLVTLLLIYTLLFPNK